MKDTEFNPMKDYEEYKCEMLLSDKLRNAEYIVIYICVNNGYAWVDYEIKTFKDIVDYYEEQEIDCYTWINEYDIEVGEELLLDDGLKMDLKEEWGKHPMTIIRIK